MSDRRSKRKDSGDKGLSSFKKTDGSSHQSAVSDAPTVVRKASSARNSSDQQTVLSANSEQIPATSQPLKVDELGQCLEGEMLGHFRLDRFVGGGGMGAVFRAHDTRLSRTVAVKILSRGQHADEDAQKRFELEAQSAARLDHENIARVYYVGEHNGWKYIVFEYIDGVDIRQKVMQGGPLPIAESVDFTLQIAEALHHASQRDVVHRDIKPSNVLITPIGKAKLVDMGLSRFHHLDKNDDELTASGVTLGTFDYISPEQARDPRNADVRSDIYSLGCTLYYMLAARPPFSEGTVLQKLLSHTSDQPPDIRQFRPDVPSELVKILQKMLVKQPDARHQQPNELIGELWLLSDKLGLSSGQGSKAIWITPAQQPLSRWEFHLSWIVPILLFALTVFGLNYFHVVHDITPVAPRQLASPNGVKSPGETESNFSPKHSTNPENSHTDRDDHDAGDDPKSTPLKTAPSKAPPAETSHPPSSPTIHHNTTSDDTPSAKRDETDTNTKGISEDNRQAASIQKETGTVLANTPPATIDPNVPKSSPPQSVRLLASDGETVDVAPTLHTALEILTNQRQQAHHVETIELCFNGRQTMQPFTVSLPEITLRAGEGFTPIVVFQPEASVQTSMLVVSMGRLKLQGIHWEVEFQQPVDHWSLFEVNSFAQIELKDCTMTVRNSDRDRGRLSYYKNVAFFHISPDLQELGNLPHRTTEVSPPKIRLNNCIARGEATFVWVRESRPFNLQWHHGLLLTTERLVHTTGSSSLVQNGSSAQIELEHVTVITDKGLCYTSVEEPTPNLTNLSLECNHCVLFTGSANPKIDQVGYGKLEPIRKQVSFRGKHLVFPIVPEGTKRPIYWRVSLHDAKQTLWELSFSQFYRRGGENNKHWSEIYVAPFRLPDPLRQVHLLSSRDYAWDQILTPEEMEYYSIHEGCSTSLLPPLPAVATTDNSSMRDSSASPANPIDVN